MSVPSLSWRIIFWRCQYYLQTAIQVGTAEIVRRITKHNNVLYITYTHVCVCVCMCLYCIVTSIYMYATLK